MNDKNYKLSIIVPVYNKEKHIEECIKSLIYQTLKDIQIIFINDGSTDESGEIIKQYIKQKKNIKYIEQNNQGVIKARINGYKEATGEYIAWVDADDFVDLRMFEKMYNLAKEKDSDVVICNYAFFPNRILTKVKWFKEYKGNVDWKFVNRNTILCNKIVKKELLDRINIISLLKQIGEGAYTMVLINTDKISTIDEELYNYRVGHKSFSTDYTNIEWFEKNIQMALKKRELIHSTKLENIWAEFFDYKISYNYVLTLIVAAYNNNKELFFKCKEDLKKMKFLKNKENKKYIIYDLGKIKGFILYSIIPNSYFLSKIISKLVLR